MRFVLSGSDDIVIADPCAGAGDALVGITEKWLARATYEKRYEWESTVKVPQKWSERAKLYGCEMEGKRAEDLMGKLQRGWSGAYYGAAVHGDAFMLNLNPGESVHACFLNPPYDVDREYKRLEERWLRRFAPLVAVGGALLFFVPYYALSASAETLARNFDSLACYRVPEPHFATFKQVVLVGRRRERLAVPDPDMLLRVSLWSEEPDCIPVLPVEGLKEPVFTVRSDLRVSAPRWELGILDTASMLAAYEPWTTTDRAGRRMPVPNISPEEPFTDIMAPRVTLGCAPRPAHIALAAGAGVLSGARLTPDVPGAGPELLLKGVHRRIYHHARWKENAKGEHIAEEREQRPELHMSVLDLAAGQYHRLRPSMEPTSGNDVSTWTVGDLLERYGGSMLAALRDRCDILYDQTNPAHVAAYPLVSVSPDPLLHAQEHATRAVLRLLDTPDRAAILLGEIGVGKSRISLTAAVHALRAARDYLRSRGRILVMCPPILLAEWRSEVAKVLPGARVVVLENNEAVDEEASREDEGLTVCLLSKEAAKLGHAHVGLHTCGKCGTRAPETPDKNASRRLHCEAVTYRPANGAARIAAFLAERLGTVFADPQLRSVVHTVGGRILRQAVDRGHDPSVRWRTREAVVRKVVRALRRLLGKTRDDNIAYAWWSMLSALADEQFIVEEARALFRSALTKRDEEYGAGHELRAFASKALLLLPPSSPWIGAVLSEFARYRGRTYDGKLRRIFDPWPVEKANRARRRGEKPAEHGYDMFSAHGDLPTYGGRAWGSDDALRYAIERVVAGATWTESDECGEPLYQAVPQPRRIPVAQYILKRHPKLFDFMILDECHQYGHGDSAQSQAAQQLLNLRRKRGIPAIGLTGSVMNGYARSLFVLLWHFSAKFREVFDHNDVGEFERRFGFLVQVVEKKDEDGKRVAFGTHSDRVVTTARTTGAAPGVVPTAVLKFLLPHAVTIQLSDLEHDLPPVVDRVAFVTPSKEQRDEARRLEGKLLQTIAADRFKAGRAGKLFGPLGHLPRYLDHATTDTGNWPDGSWTIAYPEDCDVPAGERIVVRAPGFDPATILPKEAALLAKWVGRAVEEGRNFVVATTRTALAARLHRILTGEKIKTALLDAKKVSAAKRRDWISEVRDKGIPGLIANPQALPVGLNNLAGYYSRVFLFDDPNNDPTLLRQFRGRFVRIGQTTDVEIVSLVYEGTLQEDAHDLLQKKRVIAEATDGLDASAAFQVVGVGDALAFETDLGKAIYARLVGSPP